MEMKISLFKTITGIFICPQIGRPKAKTRKMYIKLKYTPIERLCSIGRRS